MEVERDFIFDPSLALYLPLYELDGASFMSKDAHGHLCTVTGALWRHNGRYFDGTDDFINLGTPSAIKFGTGDFTIELWVDEQRTSGDGTYLSKGYVQFGHNGNYILRSHATLGLQFRVYDGGPPLIVDLEWGGYAAIRNAWHHIAITRVSGALAMYIDTEIKDTDSYTGNIGDNTHDAYLGVNAASGEWHQGLEGEVRIYSRALSPQEIQHNYEATKWRYR